MAKAEHANPRADRLAAALRQNLKRRKQQARQRAEKDEDEPADQERRPNSGGIGDDVHGR